jgi:hypothetical protein
MSTINRGPLGSAFLVGRETPPVPPMPSSPSSQPTSSVAVPDSPEETVESSRPTFLSEDLIRSIAEVKGQAQFLLYLADQIEDSLHQLVEDHDDSQNAFLCRVLGMYSAQLETKHQGLGDKIAETCQEVYVTVREFDAA